MDRNGTRLAAQIDESQNRPFAVFGRLPRIEEEIRIINGKKACLIAIERPRQIERLVLRADLVLLQRCRFFPTHAAQRCCFRTPPSIGSSLLGRKSLTRRAPRSPLSTGWNSRYTTITPTLRVQCP